MFLLPSYHLHPSFRLFNTHNAQQEEQQGVNITLHIFISFLIVRVCSIYVYHSIFFARRVQTTPLLLLLLCKNIY